MVGRFVGSAFTAEDKDWNAAGDIWLGRGAAGMHDDAYHGDDRDVERDFWWDFSIRSCFPSIYTPWALQGLGPLTGDGLGINDYGYRWGEAILPVVQGAIADPHRNPSRIYFAGDLLSLYRVLRVSRVAAGGFLPDWDENGHGENRVDDERARESARWDDWRGCWRNQGGRWLRE